MVADAYPEYDSYLLTGEDRILFFERPSWHLHPLRIAREKGVATVLFLIGNASSFKYRNCNILACLYPSRSTERIVRSYGFTNTCCLAWPL